MEVKKQWTVCFAEGISRKHDRLQCGYCTLHLLRFKVCKRAEDRVDTGNMQSGRERAVTLAKAEERMWCRQCGYNC